MTNFSITDFLQRKISSINFLICLSRYNFHSLFDNKININFLENGSSFQPNYTTNDRGKPRKSRIVKLPYEYFFLYTGIFLPRCHFDDNRNFLKPIDFKFRRYINNILYLSNAKKSLNFILVVPESRNTLNSSR